MFFRFVAITAILSFAIYWFSIRIRPEDSVSYEKLMAESVQLRTRRALEAEPASQKRANVQKDIWSQNESRHFTILSQDSHLTLCQKRDKIEAEETLKTIQCTTPNGLTLCADEGIYSYPSQQFIAQKNCHLLQGENQIDGTQIHLDLIEGVATYENPVGHLAHGVNFTAKTLFWDKDTNLLHLIDDVVITQSDDITLLAKRGTVSLDQFQATRILLEGNVRLISSRIQGKESYAMADSLHYNPLDETLLFSADRRVLFWQDGLTLSASEVLIRKDKSVEGHGNVHFTFNLEEQNSIDTFFKQYL